MQSHSCWIEWNSLGLLAIFLLRQFSTWLALFAAKPCYRPMLNFLSTKTLRCFSAKLLTSQTSSACSVASRCRILHLSLLKFMRFLEGHFSACGDIRGLWKAALPCSMLAAALHLVSLTNLLRVLLKEVILLRTTVRFSIILRKWKSLDSSYLL